MLRNCIFVCGAAIFATLPASALLANEPVLVASAVPGAVAAPVTPTAPTPAAVSPRDAAIDAFYAARGDAPFWLAESGWRARTLLALLDEAPSHALPAPALSAELRAPEGIATDRAAAAERSLSRAFIAYAQALSGGLLDPRRAAPNIMRPPVRIAPDDLMAALSAAPDLTTFLRDLAPRTAEYAALRERFAALAALPPGAWGPPVPAGPTLRPGETSPRVPALRARLTALGDMPRTGAQPSTSQLFDPALAAGVRAFQARHGLNTDGAVGAMTLAAINATPPERAAQVAVNLERLRWMNHPLGQRRIMVNQPDFTVTFYDGDEIIFAERVVVGMNSRQTPEFSDQMTHLVFNPTWFVPRSIATKDILPRLKADPSYLTRSNMVLSRGDGGPLPADPATHDFTVYTASDFPYRIRQRPDSDNALGQVKFMFPNNHAIYLHDTPKRELFARDSRAFSSGCVRVRDPLRLAELLVLPQRPDAGAFIESVIASGRERHVTLEEPVDVHLVYHTAWRDAQGRDQFRADVYGRDRAVAAALRAAGVALPDA